MQIYRGISTRTKLASKQLLLFSTLTAAILLLATTTLLFLKPTQTAKAITPPDSCFAFDTTAGRIVDYGDVITNETEPNSANSRTIGSCATSLEIPSTIGGVAVVAIGDGAFQGNSITSVTIPDSVNMIAGSAFRSNQLATLTIPESVTYVGTHSFRGNRLTHIDILPASLSIAGSAFRDNQLDALPEYFTRPGVTSIPDGVFRDNIFTELVVPDNITSIGSYAFNSNKLTSVTLSNSMTSVGGNYTFAYNQITSLVLPEGLKSIGGSYTFFNNKISSLSFPQGFTSISATHAFAGNNISNLNLPDSLLSISNYAFYNNQLESISIPISTSTIGGFAFANNQISNAVIGNPSATMQHTSFVNNPISSMKLGDNTYKGPLPTSHPSCFAISGTNITDYYQASPIVARDSGVLCGLDVLVTDAATSIGNSAFSNNQLRSVVIPGTIISIGISAFTGNQIASLELGSSVTSIGNDAFSENKLTSLDIPDSVESIGAASFYGNQISSLKLGNSLTSISSRTFANNQLISLTIPNSVTTIGDWAFSSNQLTTLAIPNSVTTIGDWAFSSNQLTTLAIPNSVTTIGDWAFSSNQLTTLTIPNSVTTIGNSAFNYNQLSGLTIPNSVTSIGNYAFSNNQLTALQLGNSLATIGNYVFAFNKLANVAIPDSVTDIHPGAFFGQNPGGGDMDRDKNSPYYIYSDDPAAVQYAYDSIWYVNLQTEDPSNPHNLQPGFISEWWWNWDSNSNGHTRDSLGGHLINPAKVTISHKSTSGSSLAPTSTHTGLSTDGSYISNYTTKDNPFLVPKDHENPTPEEQAELDAGVAKYFFANQTITLTAPPIPGYLTPPPKTITLTSANNDIDFIYQPVVKSIDFTGTTPPPAISSSLISFSSLSIDNNDNGSCSSIKTAELLDPLTPDAISSSNIPSDITLLGGLAFSLICAEGATTNISYSLGSTLPTPNNLSDIRIYKHSPSNNKLSDITNQVSITLDPTTNKPIISYELIDGSEWDEDGEVNGIIVDPIYVGVVDYAGGERLASTGNSIWIATILGTALMGVGVVGLRRI